MSKFDAPGTLRELERRAILLQSAIAIALSAFVLLLLLGYWWRSQQLRIDNISITDVRALGDTRLCPGEPLRIQYIVHIAGAGVLERDATAWKLQPPYTIVASTPERIVIDSAVNQLVEEVWITPSAYVNPRSGQQEPLPAGEYKRVIALSSHGENPISAIGGVNFWIREGCSYEK